MLTPTITPAIRFNADRVRRSCEPGSTLERGVRKAQYVESFPHSYTELMLRWAEGLLLEIWEGSMDVADEMAFRADAEGWL